MNRGKVLLFIQFGIDPLHIMVVRKIVEPESVDAVAAHFIEPLYRMCNFKIIVVVVPGVKRFVQGVIGDAVQSAFVNPAGIVPVDDLAHEPEIRLYFIGSPPERFHVFKIQNVSGIQPDSVNIKFADPEADDVTDIVSDRRIVLV